MKPPRRGCLYRAARGAPGCTSLAVAGASYCQQHGGRHSPSSRAAHTPAYRRARAAMLATGPPWTCAICGQVIASADDLAADHAIPASWGGPTDASNLVPAHRDCNKRKGGT